MVQYNWIVGLLLLMGMASADFVMQYQFTDYKIPNNMTMLTLGGNSISYFIVYITVVWSNGALDTGYFTSFGSWSDVFNITTIPQASFINCVESIYRGGTLVATTNQSNVSSGNFTLGSGTSLSNGYEYIVNTTCYATGAQSSTDSRTRTLIAGAIIPTIGGEDMGGVLITVGVAWVIFWLLAFWLYETKRPIFAYCAYLVGYFLMFLALFIAIDTSAKDNPATANMLQMFVFPATWILIASIIGFVLFIFLDTLVKMAQTFGIKIKNWWYDGQW